MAWDPYRSIAPCRLSRSSEQVPSAVGPNLLHPALLRARVKVALTEMKIEEQTERIVSLEEEVTTLHWRRACTCGEVKGKGTAVTSGSGEREEHSELEYAEEGEGSSSGASYHIPPVVPEEEPLLVFGSPISQSLPTEVQEMCGCPVPAAVRIEDDVEMTFAPRENEEAIPVQVERPPTYTVGLQQSSHGRPQAHYRSSTRRANCHAKQLSHYPYRHPSPDVQFPCARELLVCSSVLTS